MKKYRHEHTLGMKNQCFLILFLRKAYGGPGNKTRSYSQFKINNRLHRDIGDCMGEGKEKFKARKGAERSRRKRGQGNSK